MLDKKFWVFSTMALLIVMGLSLPKTYAEETGIGYSSSSTESSGFFSQTASSPQKSEPDQELLNGKEENEIIILKPKHRVLIRIYPEDEYIKGGEMEISAEGNVTLPLVGKVEIAGLKISDAEKKIAEVLDKDYLVNPEVAIELKRDKDAQQIPTKNFLVLGQVKKPGTYPVPLDAKKFTLLQAISLAGGFTEVANPKRVKIVKKSSKDRQTVQVNVEDILNGQSSDVDIQNGDVIHVPESIF